MSIYYQNYTNWYLIFINDGSTDFSLKVIENFVFDYNLKDKVKIITKENGGVNSAVQRGLEEVKNLCDISDSDSLISYCDQDDIWTRNKLSVQVEYMAEHPECDLSFHDSALIDENGILTNPSQSKSNYFKDFSFSYFGICGNLIASNRIMFRTKFIDDVLPIPTTSSLFQDERTMFVFSLIGANINFINIGLTYHRKGHQSLLEISHKLGKQYWKNKQKIFVFLQEKFLSKDLSYYINYNYDRYVNWYSKYGSLTSLRIYILILFKYPKAFYMLLKIFLFKIKQLYFSL